MVTALVKFYHYVNSSSRIKKIWSATKNTKRNTSSFLSQDDVGVKVIALDAHKRKLLYFKRTANASSCLLIDLRHLEKCSVRKEYNNINAGDLKTRKLQSFIENIFLNIGFKDGSDLIALRLYEAKTDGQQDVAQIEVKARKWEMIVQNLHQHKPKR